MQIGIVGGGINGLYLSWKLSLMGHGVTVFERKKEIGNSACSGLFSENILKYIPQSEKLILNRINSAIINFPKKQIQLKFKKDFLVMSHFELDKLVAELAQKAGVKIILNSNITKIPEGFDRVIGCDGPLSVIRSCLSLKNPKYRLGILGYMQYRNIAISRMVETWGVKNGFIWKIPRGKNIEYGIIAKPNESKKTLDDFLSKNKIILNNIQSKLIPSGLKCSTSSVEHVGLCGDAAGLTKPWSGGGVLWQLELADILLKTFPDFKKYAAVAKKKFAFKLKASKFATDLVYFLGFNFPFLLPKTFEVDNDSIL